MVPTAGQSGNMSNHILQQTQCSRHTDIVDLGLGVRMHDSWPGVKGGRRESEVELRSLNNPVSQWPGRRGNTL